MRRIRTRSATVVAGTAAAALAAGVGIGWAATTALIDTESVRLRVLQSDFPAGFDSGWHTHPGLVVVQVTAGRLKAYGSDCKVVVLQPGDSYVEVPLSAVRAVADPGSKWTTTQILRAGDPVSTTVASPCGSMNTAS